jgi:hypothetical protein
MLKVTTNIIPGRPTLVVVDYPDDCIREIQPRSHIVTVEFVLHGDTYLTEFLTKLNAKLKELKDA